jgi:formate-dependent nitrite reductase membrane component NrfD
LTTAPQATARFLDPQTAIVTGEGALQRVRRTEEHTYTGGEPLWPKVPEATAAGSPTYYDWPMLKAPVWEWYIPTYYFLGGGAGAALALGAAAQLYPEKLSPMIKRCQWIGTIGSAAGAGFLVLDLGRPERFLAMLRVIRPTSPMNMGTWILSCAAPFGTAAALFCGRRGIAGEFGKLMSYLAGPFGLALATYTGVLVSNSAIPVWYRSRRYLPHLFAASGIATAVSLLDLLMPDDQSSRPMRFICGTVARGTEIAAGVMMEREVAKTPEVVGPLRTGRTGVLWRAAEVLTATSLVLSIAPTKRRSIRIAAAAAGIVGSACLRYAVHYAGVRSARDPRASFADQRNGAT